MDRQNETLCVAHFVPANDMKSKCVKTHRFSESIPRARPDLANLLSVLILLAKIGDPETLPDSQMPSGSSQTSAVKYVRS